MNVPQEWQPHFPKRAEYLITLPPDWDIEQLNAPNYYWPLRTLKEFARIPITCNTWLGVGHTMSSDGENTPFADNTKMCSVVLTHPEAFEVDCLKAAFPRGKGVIFYQMVPIYEDELNFTRKYGFDKFEDYIKSVIVKPLDIGRPSVVPKSE
jgi:hypothetical protein